MLVALGATAVSCQREQNISEETKTKAEIRLIGSSETKAFMNDTQGTFWEVGDIIRFNYFHSGDANGYWDTDYELTSSDISGGNVATYRGNLDPANLLGVFRYNFVDSQAFAFVEEDKIANDTYTFTQNEAGVMNKSQMHLHSGLSPVAVDNSADADVQSVSMHIAGSVIRLMPYTEAYGGETIQSVSFSSSDNVSGYVRYHYGSGDYESLEEVNYKKVKAVVVNLGTPCALSGMTSRETSKGIYFSLPATEAGVSEITNYEIVVTTDVAKYHFVSTSGMTIGENLVRNVYLKLENATDREDLTAIKGIYWFDGTLAGGYTGDALDYEKEAQDIADLGYWVAYTQDSADGSPVISREPADYPDFYDNTTIEIVDLATNAAPDWLQFGYSANHANSHPWIKLTENTAASSRKAVITFNYPAVAHQYQLRANERKKVITVTQAGTVAEVKPLFKYNFSGSGWSSSWAASGRTINVAADGYTRNGGNWLDDYGIVIAPALAKLNSSNNYEDYVPGAAYPDEDVAPFVKMALGLSDAEYTEAATWLTFAVFVEGAQWLIRLDAVAANTGTARSLSGNLYNSDGSIFSTYAINQAAGSGSGGGSFTMPTANNSFLAIPGGTEPLTITVVSETEITVGTVRAAADGNPAFVMFTNPTGVTVQSVSGTGFNNANKIDDAQAGFWIPSNTSTTERTLVGTVTFTDGTSTRNMTINFVQAGASTGGGSTTKTELWNNPTLTLGKVYYAGPGWSDAVQDVNAVTYSLTSNNFTVTVLKTGGELWQAQNFIYTNIPVDKTKTYDFSCKVKSDNITANRTVNLKMSSAPTVGADEVGYMFTEGEGQKEIQPGVESTITVTGKQYPGASDYFVLIVALGYTETGAEIELYDFSLKEY